MEKNFVLKGNICWSTSPDHLETARDAYLVCRDGKSAGVYKELPSFCRDWQVKDTKGAMILPGLVDLHLHAPQYSFRGLGMDLELLDWLNQRTFPEESKYQDQAYASEAYRIFAEDLKQGATARACVFATVHRESTVILMDLLEKTGLKTLVGKVNMDRESPESLREADARTSIEETRKWLEQIQGRYENTAPILTPRFVPSCTDQLLEGLGELQKSFDLPVQSHLSENLGEIDWVKQLCPWSQCYGQVYDHYGLLDTGAKTVMAHCVWSGEEEIQLLKERGVFVAHCPQSNTNLASGIAPIRRYLDLGMNLGLGTDVAGGVHSSIFRAMADAVQVSKLRWRLKDENLKPLTIKEVFYLGTKGGGAFFGKVGSFEEGYEFDALVIEDRDLATPLDLNIEERLERLIYLSGPKNIVEKYVSGNRII